MDFFHTKSLLTNFVDYEMGGGGEIVDEEIVSFKERNIASHENY